MKISNLRGGVCALSFLCSAMLASGALAADRVGEPGRSGGGKNPLKNVYFGEQHLHTRNSPDAFAAGARQSWDDAYKWAMGEEVTLHTITSNDKIKKSTPYDFVAITDHAEYFGVMPRLIDPKDPLAKSDLAEKLQKNDPSAVQAILHSIITSTAMPEFVEPKLVQENWQRYVETANKYNDPGKFTTLIAYEWTSIPNGRNMHRNVFFRNDTGPKAPYSAFDSIYPEDLWTYMEVQRTAGNENFAIPHNGNVSDGWMYSPNEFLGGPMDARYAARQQANEPLTEIIQTKGSSDTHPAFSPNDEFAEFEIFPNMINVGQPSQIKYGYIRQGLVEGMILEDTLGSNPFKYGIVSGADSHSGYSNNEEFNFHGSHAALEDTPQKRLDPEPNASGDLPSRLSSAGTTAVWAEENTRDCNLRCDEGQGDLRHLRDLIRLRFFGGWNYPESLVNDKDFVKKAYKGGVPMGQDLPKQGRQGTDLCRLGHEGSRERQPRSHPDRQGLDQPSNGRRCEKIYDVAWSDDRKPDPKTGKLPPVGNTVDVKTATYTNDIGDTQLSAVWTDPDFDPKQTRRSTTSACWRSRRRAGRPMTR